MRTQLATNSSSSSPSSSHMQAQLMHTERHRQPANAMGRPSAAKVGTVIMTVNLIKYAHVHGVLTIINTIS
jgi:hypothetical protein